MASDFEDHCWKDVVPSDVLGIYTHYERKTFVGPSPALYTWTVARTVPLRLTVRFPGRIASSTLRNTVRSVGGKRCGKRTTCQGLRKRVLGPSAVFS